MAEAPDGDVPVLYVANGSHAIYSRAGVHDRPFPDPNDEARGDGREVRPRLQQISDTSPAWVAYEGRWGDSRAGLVPGEQSSPPGPRFQGSRAWTEPQSYHDDRARSCGEKPPGRPWQNGIALGVAAVLAAALLRRRLARRSRLE